MLSNVHSCEFLSINYLIFLSFLYQVDPRYFARFNNFRVNSAIFLPFGQLSLEYGVQKTAHVLNVLECLKRDRNCTERVYCSRMNNNADELQKLRARFIELKTTLDRRIKENDESLTRLSNLNQYIDQLLQRSKRHCIAPVLETNLSQPKSKSLS